MAIDKEDISTNLYNEESQSQYYFADDSGDSILISDEQLLFLGEYSREGADLHITHGNKNVVIDNYFSQQQTPDLTADNGATLTHDVVEALAGPLAPGQYVQAGLAGNLTKIGEVINLTGTANSKTVDGVESELVVGSAVYQGDVVSTGADSKLGISFIDKSAFSMSADARMILDELIFTPNTPEDSSMVFNLVEGAFVFVTGEVATTGNMKIETPVATMGIRGTTPKVTVNSSLGVAEFSILPDPGSGKVGSYQLINKSTGAILGTVASVGDKWVMTTLSDEVVQIGKSGSDLLEDNLALDEIRAVISGSLGDKTELDGSNQFDQVNIDDGNSDEDGEGEDGEGEESGDGEEGGGEEGAGAEFDDPPEAANDEFAIDEDTVLTGTGANVVDGSGGGGADVDPDGFGFSVTHVNGAGLNFAGGLATIILPSGAILVINGAGDITYDPNDKYDFLGVGEQDTDDFTYTITDPGGQTDTATVTVTISGRNDQPLITAQTDVGESLTETEGALVTTGEFDILDIDVTDEVRVDGVTLAITGTFPSIGTLDDGALLALLDTGVALKIDSTQTTATIGWEFDAGIDAFDYLAVGETLILTYSITVKDDSGVGAGSGNNEADSNIQDVVIIITGTNENDAPIISTVDGSAEVTGAITELEDGETGHNTKLHDQTGTITYDDVDLTDTHEVAVTRLDSSNDLGTPIFTITQDPSTTNSTTNGTLDWKFEINDAGLDKLAGGEQRVYQYELVLNDKNTNIDGTNVGTDTRIVTVTITGTNDAPVITTVVGVDRKSSPLTEDNGTLTDSDTLTVSDVDITDVITASVDSVTVVTGVGETTDSNAAPLNGVLELMMSVAPSPILANGETTGPLTWSFNSGGEAFDYLATGEKLVLSYTIKVTDDDSSSLSDTEIITVTITGTNDVPVISVETGDGDKDTLALNETDSTLSGSDTLTVTDVDTTDLVTASVESVAVGAGTTNAGNAPAGLLAMMTLTSSNILGATENSDTLTWSFNSGGQAFDYLADGEKLVLDYTIQVIDDDGTTDSQVVSVTITGTNDAPVNTVPGSQTVLEDGSVAITGLSVADVDAASTSITVTLAVTNGTLDVSGGTAGIANSGTTSVTLTGTVAQIQATLGSNVTYTPTANYNGSASLTVTTNDNDSNNPLGDTDVVNITVESVADAPGGNDNTLTLLEDTTHVFVASDFGFNDPDDSPADTFTGVKITTNPSVGLLTNDGIVVTDGDVISIADINSGDLIFTPVENANGSSYSAFTFQVIDNGTVQDIGNYIHNHLQLVTGWTGSSSTDYGWGTAIQTPATSSNQTATAFAEATPGGVIESDSANQPNAIAVAGESYHIEFDHLKLNGYGAGDMTIEVFAGTELIKTVSHVYNSGTPLVSFDTDMVQLSENGDSLRIVFTPGTGTAMVIDNVSLSQINGIGVYGSNLLINGDFGSGSYYYGNIIDPTPQTMTIDVTAVNDVPVAATNTVLGTENTAATIAAASLIANDSDVEGDTLVISAVGSAVNATVSLDGSGDVLFTPVTNFTGTATFEYTVTDGNGGSSTTTVSVIVTSASSIITGTSGDDVLNGTAGDDTFLPGNATLTNGDVIVGSAGNDTIDFETAVGYYALNYSALTEAITVDLSLDVNQVDKGTLGADTLINADIISSNGGLGIWGTSENDTLTGGNTPWVQLRGNAGDDTITGGAGFDRVDYRNSPTGVTVNLGTGETTEDGFGDTDTLVGSIEEVRGSDFDDTITGSAADERFIGRAGDDTIDGAGGIDTIRYDRVGVGSVNVDLENNTASDGLGGTDTLTNIENVRGSNFDDTITGSAVNNVLEGKGGNDSLFGLDGDDQLFGNDGNDLLVGGVGSDQLTGGAGADVFKFFDVGGTDTILDFNNGEDVINLADFLDGMNNVDAADAITISHSDGNTTLTIDDNVVATLNSIAFGEVINVVYDDAEHIIMVNGNT